MTDSSPGRWRQLFNVLVGVVASGGFLYLAARNVPAAHIWREVRRASVPLLVAAGGMVVASNVVRALRWMVLFDGAPGIRFRPVFGSMTIGYLANNVLPARLGEVVRIYLVERTTGVDVGLATATVVVERMAEALTLLLAAIGLSVVAPMPRALRAALPWGGGVLLFIAALLTLVALRPVRERLVRLVARDTGRFRLPVGWRVAITRAASQFIVGVRALRSPLLAARVFGLSVLIWGMEAAGAWLVGLALGAPLGVVGSMLLYTVVSVSFVVPAAPGGVGSYEYFGSLALSAFGLASGVAFSVALVLHVVQYAASVVLGIAGVWIEESLSFRDLLPSRHRRKT